jgi:putative phosphoesterase
MKIGVIADTHLKSRDDRLKWIADAYFGDVDIIIHAGDLVNLAVLESFDGREVKAVSGNMDSDEAREILPDKLILDIEGVRMGIIHGWGMPFGLEGKLRKKFDDIDCLIYGHTHHACNRVKEGILYFNPGSATDRKFTNHNTIGILEIGDGIKGRIIEIPR